jgi:hypothetical protein
MAYNRLDHGSLHLPQLLETQRPETYLSRIPASISPRLILLVKGGHNFIPCSRRSHKYLYRALLLVQVPVGSFANAVHIM